MTKKPKHQVRSRATRARLNWPWHKRLLLHPFTLFLLLCGGVAIIGMAWHANADTIELTAKVPAPLPASPALITTPQDQQHVTTAALTVEGSCPPNTYVQLYLNGTLSGVGNCVNGAFSIQTILSPGANQLQVKVFNTTDDEGPESQPITVYYDQPAAPSTPTNPQSSSPTSTTPTNPASPTGSSGGSGPTGECNAPLTLAGDYHYQAHYPDEQFSWQIHITNGCSPYHVNIDWGDGQTSTTQRDQLGDVTIDLNHTYRQPGSFQPIVQVTDANDALAKAQLIAVVHPQPIIAQAPSFMEVLGRYLWVLIPVYSVITVMAVSFWLGELQAGKFVARFHPRFWKHKR